MDTQGLQQFLVDSNNAGYAGGDEKKWIKEPDGSTRIPFEKGSWRSDDHFYGGEPYGGMTVIFHEDRAVWMMIYYGWVEEKVDTDTVYKVLREALKQMPNDHPYRGPRKHREGDFVYQNKWVGELDKFSGEETIKLKRKLIYQSYYRGGEVDKRRGV